MDKDLEEMIKTCHACQIIANPTQAPLVKYNHTTKASCIFAIVIAFGTAFCAT
jgi:Na+-translocating ferredoxin:NAD+ oxidoreductase RnfC subunit